MMAPAPAPVYNWTGFYLGVNGGWGWAKSDVTIDPTGTSVTDFTTQSGSATANGAVFGGQLGYNWQFAPNWVIGVEGDFDGSGMTATQSAIFPSLLAPGGGRSDSFAASEKIRWLATARGRLGYTWGPGLVYVTGGGAWENVDFNGILSTNLAPGVFGTSIGVSGSNTNSGWTVGGGLEWMLTPNWIARGEYLYYAFNNNGVSNSASFPLCAIGVACGANFTTNDNHVNVLRVGLSYKF
jgi:outer membrane immunogenic protein